MFVAYEGSRITCVTSHPTRGVSVLPLPKELEGVDSKKLIADYEVRDGVVTHKKAPKPLHSIKVAFVGVYKIQCGISTYSEFLWGEKMKMVADYRIFAEEDENAQPDERVVRCWKRGQPLGQLFDEIEKYNPDVVFVQHEYGIFPNARVWLSFMSQMQKYRTLVTLHSVYRHRDKTICEAVIPEIIVHTDVARKILVEEKKVPGRVYVIPHGSFPNRNAKRLWNLYSSPYTLLQFGFGFEYKGWERALQVVAELKKEYPKVFWTGLFSISQQSKSYHDRYFEKLMGIVKDLGIQDNVGLIKGFQSEEILESFFLTNQVALFPYASQEEHTVFGCSGAARIVMSYGMPTVVSSVPLFADLEGVCPRPDSVEATVEAVKKLFDPKAAMEQVARQDQFLEETSWKNVATRYLDILSTDKP